MANNNNNMCYIFLHKAPLKHLTGETGAGFFCKAVTGNAMYLSQV